MVSTKELVYFFGIVLFLILGISVTVFLKSSAGDSLFSKTSAPLLEKGVTLATVVETDFGQENKEENTDNNTFSREENLKNMRAKIANNANLLKEAESSPLLIPKETKKDKTEESEENNSVSGKIKTCSEQIKLGSSWVASGISFNEVGAVREVIKTDLNTGAEKTVAWLPAFKSSGGAENCLNSSVVGIALDGSLIRNNENSLYSIFSKETLLGYARDGFPIYGLNNTAKLDTCGGVMEGGQYRYYLSAERDGVLGCFSAAPINSLGD